MLIAELSEERIEAENAERGLAYVCPECRRELVLHRGRIKIPHFAHRSPNACVWAMGETPAHLQAKKLFRDCFAAQRLRSEVEFIIPSLANDRRADVMIWLPDGEQVAIELQNTNIGLDEIERRSFSYERAGITQIWLPFLRPIVWEHAEICTRGVEHKLLIRRYPARPFERFIYTLHYGELWFYDPANRAMWEGHFNKQQMREEEKSWKREYGEEISEGGLPCISKRWRELELSGPYSLDQLKIKTAPRWELPTRRYNVPGGRIARFVLAGKAADEI